MFDLKLIMEYFHCDETMANDILDRMDIDFSECTLEEFYEEADNAFNLLLDEWV